MRFSRMKPSKSLSFLEYLLCVSRRFFYLNAPRRSSTSTSLDESNLRPGLLWVRLVIYFLLAATTFAIIYAFAAKIDEVAVVPGELKPVGSISNIKSLVPGPVTQILVKDGEQVKFNQPVLRLDSTITASRLSALERQYQLLQLRLTDQANIHNFRLGQLRSQLGSLRGTLKTQQLIASRYFPLVNQGAIQEVQYLEQLNKVQALQAEAQQIESRLGELMQNFLKETKEAESSLSDLNRQISESRKLLQYETIRSPVAGRIFDLIPNRPGYIVSPGELLFKVVPDLKLEAKVFVTNQYIGFVRVGQPAEVRVDAYPFTEYGALSGTVSSISYEALQPDERVPVPRFVATVELKSQSLRRQNRVFPLKSGQTLTANIVLRKRRVASLFTDIIQRAIDSLRAVRGG